MVVWDRTAHGTLKTRLYYSTVRVATEMKTSSSQRKHINIVVYSIFQHKFSPVWARFFSRWV